MIVESSETPTKLTPDQAKLLEDLTQRAQYISRRINSEPTAELFAQRFFKELEEDLNSLKQVFPAGGKDYEDNYAGSAIMWNRALLLCPTAILDSQVMARTLRTLFGEGGRFAPFIELTAFRTPPEKGKLLAALYHMAMNEPDRYQPWLETITSPVALIVMGVGEGLEAFIKELEGLQKTFGGETHIDALPELTRQALDEMDGSPRRLRSIGGIPALAGAGVDISGLLNKLQTTVWNNNHAPVFFSESYYLIHEAIEFLHQGGMLTDKQRESRRRYLAITCFDELDRTRDQKFFDPVFWAKVLSEMAPDLPSERFDIGRVLNLIKYSDPDPQWLDEIKLADNFEPAVLKKALAKAYPAEQLYDAVVKLRALHVYSENERLHILGNRFQADLGL